jgi:hypothetical protein
MLRFAVVEHLDVLKSGCLDLGVSGIANAVHPLVLEAVEPGLRWRIVPAAAFPAHRASHAAGLELVLKVVTGVLAAPVGVVDQPQCRTLPETGHAQCIGHDIRRHTRIQRQTLILSVAQVENDGQIQQDFIRLQVGDVRRPDLIWRHRREASSERILRHKQAMLRIRRDLVTPLAARMDAVFPHHPFNPMLAWRRNLWLAVPGPCAGCRKRL